MIEENKDSSSSSVSLVTIISLFIFFAAVLGAGGLYFYKDILMKQKIKMESDLSLAKNRFEPEAINRLKIADKRLVAATEVLSKHVAISPIFSTLESLTMKTIRYTKFNYSFDGNKVEVKISGQAVGYRSVALQADLFSKNKYLVNLVFSNLSLDNKGNVLFDLSFSVDPNLIDYKHMLDIASNKDVSQPSVGIQN